MFNKIISLLLCILIITSIFVACNNSNQVEETTQASTTAESLSEASDQTEAETTLETESETESETAPDTNTSSEETTPIGGGGCPPPIDIPDSDIHEDIDYGGYDFVVLADDTVMNREFLENSNGELVKDTIVMRQEYVEEFLGIKFHLVVLEGGYGNVEEYASEIAAASGAGTPYDLALAHNLIPPVIAAKGLARDLAESEALNLYHTEKPYWAQKINQEILIGGRFFWASDTASYNNLHHMLCIFTNLEYFSRINEGYDKNDLYSFVTNKTWTMESMFVLAQGAYENINKEGEEAQGADDLDSYGLQADESGDWLDNWLYATGLRLTSLKENGTYHWDLAQNEVVSFIDWWQEALNDDDVDKQDGSPYKMFEEGRAMFALSNLGMVEQSLEIECTILPLPFYNYAIKNTYSTPLADGYSSWLIPRAIKKEAFQRSSTVLETLAGGANRYIAPAYFEIYLKRQLAVNDPEMKKMFNIIRDSVVFDIGHLYGYSLTVAPLDEDGDEIPVYVALRNVWAGNGTGDYADIETIWSKIKDESAIKLSSLMTELLNY
ncbi:MAG: hypothetical protein IKL59_02395 [Clostridia bacterium]|nr:hypothetical protein [Clostridia bacterium]